MSRACASCNQPVPHRYSLNGAPLGSFSLRQMDPAHFFCTLRCAAEFGVKCAESEGRFNTGERRQLRDEDKAREAILRARLAK